jgi:hypothetical protein
MASKFYGADGYHATFESASAARAAAEEKYGFNPRHGEKKR